MSISSKKVIGIFISFLIVGFLLITLVNSGGYSNIMLFAFMLSSILLGYLIKQDKEITREVPQEIEESHQENKIPEEKLPEEFRKEQERFQNLPENKLNKETEKKMEDENKDFSDPDLDFVGKDESEEEGTEGGSEDETKDER